jgi:hypothetical protein
VDVDPEPLPAQAVMPKAAASKNNAKYTLKRGWLNANFLLTKMNGDRRSGMRTNAGAGPGRVSVNTTVI